MRVKSTAEELLELARKLLDRRSAFKSLKDDDDYDIGYKDGARKGIDDAIEMIYGRLEELLREDESNG